jgi:DNA-binding GntR family transcriptional regulator
MYEMHYIVFPMLFNHNSPFRVLFVTLYPRTTGVQKRRGPVGATETPPNMSIASSGHARADDAAVTPLSIHGRLRRDIVTGELMPDQRLRITDLMDRYVTGANPLREALNRLCGEALVVYSSMRGFAVSPISLRDLKDLTRARCMLSDIALREAVRLGDDDWEERVLVAMHRLRRSTKAVGPVAPDSTYERVHRSFHSELLSGCGSEWMVRIAEHLFDHFDRYRNLARVTITTPPFEEHRALAEALLARDAELAVRLGREHIERLAERVARGAEALLDSHDAVRPFRRPRRQATTPDHARTD